MKVVRFHEPQDTNQGLSVRSKKPRRKRKGKRTKQKKNNNFLLGAPKAHKVYDVIRNVDRHESIEGLCTKSVATNAVVENALNLLTGKRDDVGPNLKRIARMEPQLASYEALGPKVKAVLSQLAVDEQFKALLHDDGDLSLGSSVVSVGSNVGYDTSSRKAVTWVLVTAARNKAAGKLTVEEFKAMCGGIFLTDAEHFSDAFAEATGHDFKTLQAVVVDTPEQEEKAVGVDTPEQEKKEGIEDMFMRVIGGVVDTTGTCFISLEDVADDAESRSQTTTSIALEMRAAVATAMFKWSAAGGIGVGEQMEVFQAICTEEVAGKRGPKERPPRSGFPTIQTAAGYSVAGLGVVAALAFAFTSKGKGGKGH